MVKYDSPKFAVGQLVGTSQNAHPSHTAHGLLWVVDYQRHYDRRTSPYYLCKSIATGEVRMFMEYELTSTGEHNDG